MFHIVSCLFFYPQAASGTFQFPPRPNWASCAWVRVHGGARCSGRRCCGGRRRLRERRADALLYALVDLCADELVAVTRAFFARLTWLEEEPWLGGLG